jgi:acetolactate synthase-1/2/3 large subunit
MKLSDYVINFLVSEGVTHIFEVCGGALAHLLDSLYGRKDIAVISMHHEMAASIAAEGYSRASGNIGVAMATSGPGATNMITGIGSCFFDSIPCLFITGQVNTYEFKFDRPVRQVGFQETDIVSIVKPLVKKATLITDENMIKYYLVEATQIAKKARPGPVLLDIPLNVQRANIDPKSLETYTERSARIVDKIDKDLLDQLVQLIKSASRPVIIAGGGVRLSKAQNELFEFVSKTGIPVVTSLMGLDSFPHNHPSFAGMIGTYGNRYANLTVANSDLVLALGTRLDTRQTGTRPETFARGAKIVHVDIDPFELDNKVKAAYSINSDVKQFLTELVRFDLEYEKNSIKSWLKKINHFKSRYPAFTIPAGDVIEPNYFMHLLSEFIPDDAIICVDVGQNQMWSAQSLETKGSQRLLTQGGMASMGSALPMAIGASFAKPGKIIVVITGDGGFQLNLQELQTVYHHNLPIKIILLNNNCYGMVRQFQEQYFNGRYQSTVVGYSNPDFQDVVRAYKIQAMKIARNAEITSALPKLFCNMQPTFLEVSIDIGYNVVPKLSVNKPIEDQDPILSREELKSNLFVDVLPDPEKL